jgi:hypothetical protein
MVAVSCDLRRLGECFEKDLIGGWQNQRPARAIEFNLARPFQVLLGISNGVLPPLAKLLPVDNQFNFVIAQIR